MGKAASQFNDEKKKRIAAAVAAAEAKTSAEIVPVVAAVSGRYDRAEDLVGLWCGLLALAAVWLIYPEEVLEHGSWGSRPWWLELACLLTAVVAGFVGGAFLASRIDGLRRLLTPSQQMHEEVSARAHTVFFDQRIHHTTAGTGLLLYVSLFERMAAVVADGKVLEKLGQGALDEICARLTRSLTGGSLTEAICTVIHETGDRLAAVLPRSEGQVNELPDVLITIER